jgi:beta-glucosidase
LAFATSTARSRFARPLRTLVGYKKIFLEPGERKSIVIPIDKYSAAVWDERRNSWCCEKGVYISEVVTQDSCLKGSFKLEKDMFWNGL